MIFVKLSQVVTYCAMFCAVCKLQTGLKLLNMSLAASLVVLAGDVSLNPGPIKDPCVLCAKGCRANQKAVQCDDCDRWFHAKCMNMNHREYLDVSNSTANWCCTDCLFPGPFSPTNSDCNMKTTASNDSNDPDPEVHLVRGFKIAHLNINRLINKMDDVRELMSTHVFDVLALSETWLSPNITHNEVDIPGYTVARKDRTGSAKLNGGGVLLYVRENIPFTVKNDLAAKNEELLWIEINRPKCKPLLIAAAYKPSLHS